VGSSAGQTGITMSFGDSRSIRFNNTNLTFYGGSQNQIPNVIHSEIADMGVICPESVTWWPGGTALPQTVFVGHTYQIQFVTESQLHNGPPPVTTYVGFTVDAYSNGVLTYTWIEY
jgi:hypothetical protein